MKLPIAVCLVMLLGALTGPASTVTNTTTMESNQLAVATFGGGCFWCLEAVFQMLPGVKSVASGYAGGHEEKPTYQNVCAGVTGHAEVVQITHDPAVITFEELLKSFWEVHDPTTLNRQGNDVGTQYRSIILYHDDAQRRVAETSKAEAQKHFARTIVTEIVPLKQFHLAEDYHQDYYRNNPNAGYCRVVIRPKVEKFEKKLRSDKP